MILWSAGCRDIVCQRTLNDFFGWGCNLCFSLWLYKWFLMLRYQHQQFRNWFQPITIEDHAFQILRYHIDIGFVDSIPSFGAFNQFLAALLVDSLGWMNRGWFCGFSTNLLVSQPPFFSSTALNCISPHTRMARVVVEKTSGVFFYQSAAKNWLLALPETGSQTLLNASHSRSRNNSGYCRGVA